VQPAPAAEVPTAATLTVYAADPSDRPDGSTPWTCRGHDHLLRRPMDDGGGVFFVIRSGRSANFRGGAAPQARVSRGSRLEEAVAVGDPTEARGRDNPPVRCRARFSPRRMGGDCERFGGRRAPGADGERARGMGIIELSGRASRRASRAGSRTKSTSSFGLRRRRRESTAWASGRPAWSRKRARQSRSGTRTRQRLQRPRLQETSRSNLTESR